MIALIVGALTSRVAGPIASVAALALMVSTCAQTVRLKAAEGDLGRVERHALGVQNQFDRCRSNRSALEASIAEQNVEIETFARVQGERLAQAREAVKTAAKGRADAERRAAKLLDAQPQGVDACSRFMAADRAVLDSLR